jgi:catechol 2,3-dioxygenase-like lactoylglutathione lyase family enzyme
MDMLSNGKISAVVPVTNLARARNFYEGTLGLTPNSNVESAGAIEYENAGSMLILYERETPTSGEHTTLGFMLSAADFEAAVDGLRAKGVTFDVWNPPGVELSWDSKGVMRMDNGASAWFKDPDGNVISLMTGTMG